MSKVAYVKPVFTSKIFQSTLKQIDMHNICYVNTMDGRCDYKCKVFKDGLCSNGRKVIYDTHEDQLKENLIEAKGEFYVMALQAIANHASITDILLEYYEYKVNE